MKLKNIYTCKGIRELLTLSRLKEPSCDIAGKQKELTKASDPSFLLKLQRGNAGQSLAVGVLGTQF